MDAAGNSMKQNLVKNDNKPGYISFVEIHGGFDGCNPIQAIDFVHDFGAVETARPSARVLDRSIEFLMKPPITVNEDSGLLRAYALMLQHNLHVLPVLSEDGQLVGMASRVDIGTAIVSTWSKVK